MEAKIFNYPITIRESHLDTFGHVNNAVYLQIYEEARWELVTANGYGLKHVIESQQGPTLLEVTIRFMKEMKLRDHVEIKTQAISYEGKICKIRQWIEREGVTLSEAVFTVALFDLKARKLIAPTPAWLKAIGRES